MRSPYGRRGPYGTIARLFAERGYHGVLQSTRGTFGSGGQVDFDREAADGRAAADWIIEQRWSNGEIGGFGGSYLSFTQLALASTRPPQLKAMALRTWGAERRASITRAARFAWAGRWAGFMISSRNRPLAFVRTPLLARRHWLRPFAHLPLLDADKVAVGRPVGYYRAWVEHDQPGDPYWTPTDFRPTLPDLGIPVTMTAGWYDMFLPSMLADYQALREGGQTARLRVGPWHHSSQHLFRVLLPGRPGLVRRSPARRPGTVLVLRPGRDDARRRMARPATVAAAVPASSGGTCSPRGALATRCRPQANPAGTRYDPADPTPAVGGTSSSPANAGPKDNRELERRPDVLTYTSAPLAARPWRSPVPSPRNCSSAPAAPTPTFRPPVRRGHPGPFGEHHRRADPADGGRASADTHRPVADRPPVRSRPPDPAPGLQRRPPPVRAATPAPGNRWRQRQPSVRPAGGPPRPPHPSAVLLPATGAA